MLLWKRTKLFYRMIPMKLNGLPSDELVLLLDNAALVAASAADSPVVGKHHVLMAACIPPYVEGQEELVTKILEILVPDTPFEIAVGMFAVRASHYPFQNPDTEDYVQFARHIAKTISEGSYSARYVLSNEITDAIAKCSGLVSITDLLSELYPTPQVSTEAPIPTHGAAIPNTLDLTEMARMGELDPFFGREKELSQIETILLKRTKNSPILVGEPGVGKTALVEAIAQRIASGRCHPRLKNKRILSLDVANLLAGASLRGQFEERIKNVVEALETDRNTILFIDEAHTMVGAGTSGGDHGPDMANILKPALARRRVQLIAATTHKEYERIASDGALARRFNPVIISEPTDKETLFILDGLRKSFEEFHAVKISPNTVGEAVRVARAHVHNGRMPDKAIDILDEACTIATRRAEENKELMILTDQIAEYSQQFASAISSGDFVTASIFRTDIDNLRSATSKMRPTFSEKLVEPEDIHSAVYNKIGATVSIYDKGTKKSMEDVVQKVGASVASHEKEISLLCDVLRTGYALSRNPVGSVVLYGPKGCGKTSIAKALGAAAFSKTFLINLADYATNDSASSLFGSSRGFRDSEQGGILVNAVRNHPNTLLVLENLDRASQNVAQMVASSISQGFLKDGLGREASLKDVMIIFTVTPDRATTSSLGFHDEETNTDISKLVNSDIASSSVAIGLRELQKDHLPALFSIQMKTISERLDRVITWSPDVELAIIKEYDKSKGGRSITNAIQSKIETAIAEQPGYFPIHLELIDGIVVASQQGEQINDEVQLGTQTAQEPIREG